MIMALENVQLRGADHARGRSVAARRPLAKGSVVCLYPVQFVFEAHGDGRTLSDVHGCAGEYHVAVSLLKRGLPRAFAGLCTSTVTQSSVVDLLFFPDQSAFNYAHPYDATQSVCVGQFINDLAATGLVATEEVRARTSPVANAT